MEPEKLQEFLSQYKLTTEISLQSYIEEIKANKDLLSDYDFQGLVKTLQDKMEVDFEENIRSIFQSRELDPELMVDDPHKENFQISLREFVTTFTLDIDAKIRTDLETSVSKM